MKTVYQVRVEGPKRSFESRGHFFSKRVFISLDRAKAHAPEFEERCCGQGFYDLERVTNTLSHPLVAVLVEEILGDLYAPEVTHYSWQYVEGSQYRHGDAFTMIQVRTGGDLKDPKRALMFLSMCFTYGLDAAIAKGDGAVVAMRITRRVAESMEDA